MRTICTQCNRVIEVHCTPEQVAAWRAGTLIQNAMPDTPEDERELLISGTCGDCWNRMFATDEDDAA